MLNSVKKVRIAKLLSFVIIGIRFLVFGVTGVIFIILSSVQFCARYLEPNKEHFSLGISLALGLLGCVFCLIGVGRWREWKYILVFLIFGITLILVFLFGGTMVLLPPFPGALSKLVLPSIVAAATLLTLRFVRRSYHEENPANSTKQNHMENGDQNQE